METNLIERTRLKREGGEVSVKAVLIIAFLALAAFVLIKLVPVYVEQQQVEHSADELARKASLGLAAYNKDKINNEIQSMISEFGLPEGSIQLSSLVDNQASISVKYTRNIDFLVTSIPWDVNYTSSHRGI